MLEVNFTLPTNVRDLDGRVKEAVAEKLTDLTRRMREKVDENLNGKVLQKISGQLAGSIRDNVDTTAEPMSGVVWPDPATPKAWALEKGGKSYYPIFPVKAALLSWMTKDSGRIFRKSVNHPPSHAFHYLESALDEMRDLVPTEFQEAIQAVLDGRK